MFRHAPCVKACAAWLLACGLVLCWSHPAAAAVIVGNSQNVTDSSQLPGVFSSPFPTGGSVIVSGFSTQQYDGEGFVIGPKVEGGIESFNLTSLNGLPFIINDRFGSGSDRITMEFSFPIYSLSFDFQIFPNANVPDGRGKDPTNTQNWPDFTFTADGEVFFHEFGVTPGSGPFTGSPNNPNGEFSPQYVGSAGTFFFPNGATSFQFIDWPPVIGINNLQFNIQGTNTPEPTSLGVVALLGIASLAWRRRPQPAPVA